MVCKPETLLIIVGLGKVDESLAKLIGRDFVLNHTESSTEGELVILR
jgi:hypothetical protein